MRWWVVALWLCGGCSLFLGSDDEPGGSDGGVVDKADAGDGGAAHRFWRFEVDAARLESEWIPGNACVIDTGTGTTIDCNFAGQSDLEKDVHVLWADSVQLNDSIRVFAERPLVIAARTIIVDANGTLGFVGREADGGPPAYCSSGIGGTLARGGGGAGFGTGGAEGGGSTGVAGLGVSLEELSGISVGCPGGAGQGARAPGGGGVQLIATESLQIDGAIFAHGASGLGGAMVTGGGGGGSGGMIVLDSPSITINNTALIAANGGAGGSGGASGSGAPGVTNDGFACSVGGLSVEGSGAGGAGACADNAAIPGSDGNMSTGDGGGGGGLGYVLINGDAQIASAMISPVPMVAPDP